MIFFGCRKTKEAWKLRVFFLRLPITSTFPEIWSVRISNLFLKEFMLRWAKTIRLGFFVRITFRLLSETTSDKRSGISSLDSHSWTFTSKQFESISSQKVDLKYLRKLLANKELPFLFKCNLLYPSVLPWCYYSGENLYFLAAIVF